jgi:hypothetical protein
VVCGRYYSCSSWVTILLFFSLFESVVEIDAATSSYSLRYTFMGGLRPHLRPPLALEVPGRPP